MHAMGRVFKVNVRPVLRLPSGPTYSPRAPLRFAGEFTSHDPALWAS